MTLSDEETDVFHADGPLKMFSIVHVAFKSTFNVTAIL